MSTSYNYRKKADMSDIVHVFIEKIDKDRRHIVAFSVGDKELTQSYAKFNAIKSKPDLEYAELNLTEVNLKCNYILSNLNLEMVDELKTSAIPQVVAS